jgi:methanogenic corrinoid protein MtbC1
VGRLLAPHRELLQLSTRTHSRDFVRWHRQAAGKGAELLRWCVYCQGFQGEVPPYADLNTTHGMCPQCKAQGLVSLEAGVQQSQFIQKIQDELMRVGRLGDVQAAQGIIAQAVYSGLRQVDIMVGLIAPLLYIIGEQWEQGNVSVAEEHRFTLFCENVFHVLNNGSKRTNPEGDATIKPTVVLVNAYGNNHTLGLRILAMWLRSKHIDAQLLEPTPAPIELLSLCQQQRPVAVLISLALPEQRPGVVILSEALASVSEYKPIVAVGGYAVKMGLTTPIQGTQFVTDITYLVDFLRQLPPN